jgi:hypothetical protein
MGQTIELYSTMLLTSKSSNGLGVVWVGPHPFSIRPSSELRQQETLRHPVLRYSSGMLQDWGPRCNSPGPLLGVDEMHVSG